MKNMLSRRKFVSNLAVAGAALSGFPYAHASEYPGKPIQIYVPFGAGGSTDVLARAIGDHYFHKWSEPAVVMNKPGGGGSIAAAEVLNKPSDGYSLLAYSDSYAIVPAIYPDPSFDAKKDFVAVGELATAINVVIVPPNSRFDTLEQLIDAAHGGESLTYSTPGVGSATHMMAVVFLAMAKIDNAIHVPYKSTPMSVNAIANGECDFEFAPIFNARPLIASGKLKALAVSSADRSPLLPDVPSVAEAGVPGYDRTQWWGLFAPAGVPESVVDKLKTELQEAVQTEKFKTLLNTMSSTPGTVFGDDFQRVVDQTIDANVEIARINNISVNQ